MTIFDPESPVDPDEKLARYIFHRSDIRANGTVKPDPFIPHPYEALSVTRHDALSESELWRIGRSIAEKSGKTLRGRADTKASTYIQVGLTIEPSPDLTMNNPNHADVTGWPTKDKQKAIALIISAACDLTRFDGGDPNR